VDIQERPHRSILNKGEISVESIKRARSGIAIFHTKTRYER
jgi:hypothetical protein